MQSPHGARSQPPKVIPAPDLPKGAIQVILSASTFEDVSGVEGQQVTLLVNKHSIERGDVNTSLVEKTDARGRVSFPPQPTESDHIYRVKTEFGNATFSSAQFQFRSGEGGLRVVVPVFPSTDNLDSLLLLSRGVIAFVPQDDLFAVDFLWRIENYSEKAWTPKGDLGIVLPEGFRALNIRKDVDTDARFEADGDKGVKFAGTFAPGQHDMVFRFHLPTEGKSERKLYIPTPAHLGSLRVILDGSPGMVLTAEGFPAPDVTRNQNGQRRMITTRDFLKEGKRPPDLLTLNITGIPTPPGGRSVAVGIAAVLALAGVGTGLGRKRDAGRGANTRLSKEDRERASELLLEELISLERAFEQGAIGRKTHEQAKRQLLEAYARLGGRDEEEEAA